MIQIVFLAQLREQLECAGLQLEPSKAATIDEVKTYLCETNPSWKQFLGNPKLLVALNHEYARHNLPIKSGDEVAFFPPVTGG